MIEPYTFDITKSTNDKGKLFAFGKLPFDAKNVFWVYMIAGKQRGEHAHLMTCQILYAQVGELTVNTEHLRKSKSFHLRPNGRALYLPPLTWITVRSKTPRALCLCISSLSYDETDYIRNYEDYRNEVHKSGSSL